MKPLTLFGEESSRTGTPPVAPPRHHYAWLLAQTGLSYGTMTTEQRIRVGRLTTALQRNGIPDRRIREEGNRLRTALGRPPTLEELAARLLS